MSRTLLHLGITALVLAGTAGCTPLDPIELPELTVVNMTLADVTLFETEAQFEVRIANASPDAMVLDGGAMHIYLEGIKIGKGLLSQRVEIPRLDSMVVKLPVYINNLSVATQLKPILEQGSLNYRIKGVLFREAKGLGARKLRTASEGTFSFGEGRQASPPD